MFSMSNSNIFLELDSLVLPFHLADQSPEHVTAPSDLPFSRSRQSDPFLLPAQTFKKSEMKSLKDCPLQPPSPDLDALEANWTSEDSRSNSSAQSLTDCAFLSFSNPSCFSDHTTLGGVGLSSSLEHWPYCSISMSLEATGSPASATKHASCEPEERSSFPGLSKSTTSPPCTPSPIRPVHSSGWQRNGFNLNGKRASVQMPSPVKKRRCSDNCPVEAMSQQALEEQLKDFIHHKWLVHGRFYTPAQIEKDSELQERWKDQGEGKLYKEGFPRLSGEKMRSILAHCRAGGNWRSVLTLTPQQQEALRQDALKKTPKKARR